MKQATTFHAHTVEEVLQELHADREGLSLDEVQQRQGLYGANQLPQPRPASVVWLFARQFKSVLILILLAAAVISAVLGDITDALIILAAVLMNVIVGCVQEYKAERALESLRSVLQLEAKVLRDTEERLIPAAEVVPGDVLLLDAGDRVAADARVVEAHACEVNEAPLTGESGAVTKQTQPVHASSVVADRSNMLFAGTVLVNGSGRAVVVATGAHTEVGRIAELLSRRDARLTPLQKTLDQFSLQIGLLVCVIAAAVVGIGLWKGLDFVAIFTTAVAIAVAAIPEGLAVSVTVILAIGMQRILKRNALVNNLQAAETLGSTSVICTDKTGTLTEGQMQVVSLVTHDYHFQELHTHATPAHEREGVSELLFALRIGVLCNDAHIVNTDGAVKEWTVIGNVTERALLMAGLHAGIDHAQLMQEEPRLATLSFDSTKKFMATLHQLKHERRLCVKGAPERLLALSTHIRVGAHDMRFSPSLKQEFEKRFLEYSSQGLRILALAYRQMPQMHAASQITAEDCHGLTFAGFVALQDPLRKEIHETIEQTKRAGIRTVMVTGDHVATATAIARQIGLPTGAKHIIDGETLHGLTQEQLNARVQEISVYARVSPEDKLNIIQAWQAQGSVVAMTGDGVNDAPALRAADIGIALGSGTDVAKEASDMVLLDDRYQTIVAAIEEGRGIFDNIRKVVMYLLSSAFAEMTLIVAALLIGLPLPLSAAQILWINLVADGLPNIALTVDPKDADSMQHSPRNPRQPIVTARVAVFVVCVSFVLGLGTLGLFHYWYQSSGSVELARSVAFAALGFGSVVGVFSIRSIRHPLFSRALFSNPWLIAAVLVSFIIQLSAFTLPALRSVLHTVSLPAAAWGTVAAFALGVIALFELMKYSVIIRKHS